MNAPEAGQSTAQRGASHVATGDLFGVVWQPVNIPGGRKKWIEVRSKSWVTEIADGCHVGYRGEYLGVENKTAEECMNEIGAMLDHFHASSPNDKVSYHADNAGGAHGKESNGK
jgi:hypothetical protein